MKKIFCLMSLCILMAFSVFADVEPNGSPGKAEELKLGKTYTGVIHGDESPSDINGGVYWNSNDRNSDWFYFDAPCNGKVSVYVKLEADRNTTSTGGNRLNFKLGMLDKNNFTKENSYSWGISVNWFGSTKQSGNEWVSIDDDDKRYVDSETVNYTVNKGRQYFRLYGEGAGLETIGWYEGGGVFRHTYEFEIEFEPTHGNTKQTITPSTCKTFGESKTVCTICNEVVDVQQLDKLPHTPEAEWKTISEVSCSQEGKKVLLCKICGEESDTKIEQTLPHTFGEWVTDKETSCKEAGEQSRTCSVCSHKETKEIKILDHTFAEWVIDKETSCVSAGEKSRVCTACNHKEKEEIKILEHTLTDWTITKQNTCTSKGEAIRTCKKCDYKEDKVLEMLDHSYGNWEVLKEASCTEQGKRKHTCTVCTKVEEEVLEKLEHNYGRWTETLKATESSKGLRSRVCNDCKYQEDEYLDKLKCGAEYTWKTITEATCTTSGSRKKICKYCGKTLKTETVNAYGHDYGKWKVIITPTKYSNGTESRSCSLCNKTETRSVTLTHGEYGEWKVTKEATCKETGVKSFICLCCDKTIKTKTISKTDHTYGTWTETTPTPEKNGKKERKCSVCGDAQSETVKYSFEDFKKKPEKSMPFKDIKSDAWYKSVVGKCYHYSLMVGNSESTFNPTGNITIAEVITSAVRIYCLYNPDSEKPVVTGNPWYKGYVDFAIKKNIIKSADFDDYAKPATRAQMAYIFANCAGGDALTAINNYSAIPDVKNTHIYAKEIFKLYNAGILSGNDAQGTFFPEKNIIRAEAAAIIARISNISDRVKQQKA